MGSHKGSPGGRNETGAWYAHWKDNKGEARTWLQQRTTVGHGDSWRKAPPCAERDQKPGGRGTRGQINSYEKSGCMAELGRCTGPQSDVGRALEDEHEQDQISIAGSLRCPA